MFDLADSFYFETLGGVVECESPNPTDRGFVLHIGNCLGLEGSFSSPPYSSLIPFDETSSGPPAYSPPTSSLNPSSSTSTALVPIEPLPIWLACPEVNFWWGQNFYSSHPKYLPVEDGPAHSILKVVGRGPYHCRFINEWHLYSYLPTVLFKI